MYDDELLRLLCPENPSVKGHVRVSTQKSFDAMSEEDFAHLATACSFASITLFEAAGAQGTNIIINEEQGVMSADVVARTEGDSLSFRWDAHQALPEELDDIARRIREQVGETTNVQATRLVAGPVITGVADRKEQSPSSEHKGESYLVRQLRRRP